MGRVINWKKCGTRLSWTETQPRPHWEGGEGYFENPILAWVYQRPSCYKSVTKLLPKTVPPVTSFPHRVFHMWKKVIHILSTISFSTCGKSFPQSSAVISFLKRNERTAPILLKNSQSPTAPHLLKNSQANSPRHIQKKRAGLSSRRCVTRRRLRLP